MKKISYLFLLVSILFLFSGCRHKTPQVVKISKVNIIAYEKSDSTGGDLILRLCTNYQLHLLQVLGINSDTRYETVINKIDDYIYDVVFYFFEDVNFSQISIQADTKQYLFNIGHYQLYKNKDNDSYTVSNHIAVRVEKGDSLIQTFASQEPVAATDVIYINNLTNHALVITSVALVTPHEETSLRLNTAYISNKVINKNSEKNTGVVYVSKHTNYQLGYVVVVNYNYLGFNYQYYYSTYNKENTSTMVSSVLFVESEKS